jgi:regulator of cell morphogenesis and NO signaling
MERAFEKSMRIGDIAAAYPGAIETFLNYNIDFCCGGDRPLEAALKEKNINEEEVMDRLNTGYMEFKNRIDKGIDWRKSSMPELIDYVVNKHHAFLRNELPVAQKLLTKILNVHYSHSGKVLSQLYKLYMSLMAELEVHIIKEEEILFPIIKQYAANPSEELRLNAIKVMEETEDEHEGAGEILKEMREITNNYTVPPEGCMTFQKTYDKLVEIEQDLFNHIHLENNILFPRLKK